MKRRDLTTYLGSGAMASTFWPLVARAQISAKRPLIALLAVPTSAGYERSRNGLIEGLHEAGYFEGRNIDLVERYADGFLERLPALAEELVRLKPDVVVAQVSSAALALRRITTTVPIVVGTMADPVRMGLIASDFELFEYQSPDQRTVEPKNSDYGGHHFAFYVDDIDAAVAYLRSKGLKILGDVKRDTAGPTKGLAWVYVLAPWGTQLEFVSYPNNLAYEHTMGQGLWDPRSCRANPSTHSCQQ